LKWFSSLSQSGTCVGVELTPDHTNIVYRDRSSGNVLHAVSLYLDDKGEPSEATLGQLQTFIDEHNLKNATCNLVLPSSEYQLLLLERPEVPDAELREAVKWKVKDLIQEPVESVVIETFALPQTASKGKQMIYVVVASLEKLQTQIDMIHNSSLKLNAIDIDVLALRNLVTLKKVERSAAIVRLAENQGDVSIFLGDELYLSRHFNLKYGGGLLDELPSTDLALELQRSFDYFERQMGQTPPSVVFICGEGVGPEKITEELNRSIAAKVQYFDVSEDIGISASEESDIDEGIMQLCIAAIGATYRTEAA